MFRHSSLQPLTTAATRPVSLKDAIAEFITARSLKLSSHTIADYRLTLERLCQYLDLLPCPLVSDVTRQEIEEFLGTIPGGDKNRLNAYIGLSALWTWCIRVGYASDHVVRRIDQPSPTRRVIVPFTTPEVRMLFLSAEESSNPLRDTAILKFMLDNGARASEVCGVKVRSQSGTLFKVLGKGGKERLVPVSDSTLESIRAYLASRKAVPKSPLFAAKGGTPLTRDGLGAIFERLGNHAGVMDCYPHKCRHTFATNYLRNGGDAYTLQAILGHSTMEMVKRYLEIVSNDMESRHREASPIKHWGI